MHTKTYLSSLQDAVREEGSNISKPPDYIRGNPNQIIHKWHLPHIYKYMSLRTGLYQFFVIFQDIFWYTHTHTHTHTESLPCGYNSNIMYEAQRKKKSP